MVSQNLLRNSLVTAKHHSGRAATGERNPVHSQEGGDVLVEAAVIFELVGEIEDHVWLERLQLLAQHVEIIENSEVLDPMAEFAQCLEHVSLGFAVLNFEIRFQVV